MEKMYRVLLANGSEEFCGKLGVALKQTNRYSVVGSACDGVRAISLLKELKPDLLVVDLMLPQADGLSVLKAAAGLDPKPKLLVLVEFVTEYVSSMFMTLGVQYIMLKPCSCRAVVERLDEICESAVSRKPAIAAKRNADSRFSSNISAVLSIFSRKHSQYTINLYRKKPSGTQLGGFWPLFLPAWSGQRNAFTANVQRANPEDLFLLPCHGQLQ